MLRVIVVRPDVESIRNYVCGDDRGLVSLYRYPALGGKGRIYGGHSSHVTTVRFSPDGKRLYSAGGADTCVCEWVVS
eukprot:1184839-Prorocentrum_minimum.AAC.8